MIYSMTGYAVAARELESAVLNLELRSVNHRYLDIQFRMPDELRAIEPALREMLAARLNRGKVECRISYMPDAGPQRASSSTRTCCSSWSRSNARVREALPEARQPQRLRRAALAGHARLRHARRGRDARGLPRPARGGPRGIQRHPRARRREAESHAPRARRGGRGAHGRGRAAHAAGDRRRSRRSSRRG